MPEISREEVRHLADLARIDLSDAELDHLAPQLAVILDSVASMIEEFRVASAESRRIAAPYSLDDQAMHNRRGPLSVRWIYVHMIEELACHTGHGEILREQIDAGFIPPQAS